MRADFILIPDDDDNGDDGGDDENDNDDVNGKCHNGDEDLFTVERRRY